MRAVRECQGRVWMHICYFVYSASEKAQVTFEKRERSGQTMWFPLGGEILALGIMYSILMGAGERAWILEKCKETTGLYGVSNREGSRR